MVIEIPTNFFSHGMAIEDVKKIYKTWIFKIHPDLHRDKSLEEQEFLTATMQELNRQYEEALRNCDGKTSVGDDGTSRTYKYDRQREQDVQDMLDKVIETFHDRILSDEIEVMLIGVYIWIGKTIREDSALLNAKKGGIGFFWNNTRQLWYWKPEDMKSYRSNKGLGDIAAKYGYSNIKDEVKTKKAPTKNAPARVY